MKRTVVLGASPNPERYSFKAVNQLVGHGHEVIAVGNRAGSIGNELIVKELPEDEVDTVTLYLNPQRQVEWYDPILKLHPRRVIFNPGAENPELESKLNQAGIITDNACTLVLLSTEQY